MNQFYNKLMAVKGAEELRNVVNRWETLSENLASKPVHTPIILPDMLWIAKSGVGVTNLLKLISEYLFTKHNLMEFYGDVKFFEFLLEYCRPEAQFTELQRLMDEVDNAKGFRSEFKGIIHIDINQWLEHYEERHFVSFMEYLSSNSDEWLVVLSIDSDKEDKIHNLNAFLSMYLRVEKVEIILPQTEDLLDHVEARLGKYHLSLESDARELLYQTIGELRKNKYFDGFKSINMLCQDIIYAVFSRDKIHTESLSADMLGDFSKDSDYVKRMVANIEKVRKIGFINNEE